MSNSNYAYYVLKYYQAFSHLLSHSSLEHCQEIMEGVDQCLLDLFKMRPFSYFCLILFYEQFCATLSFSDTY